MAVDVVDAAELRMGFVQQLLDRLVIRRVKALDAPDDRFNAELFRVDGPPILQRPPDQRLADLRLAARLVGARPLALDQVEVDIARIAVWVQVGARPLRRQQRRADLGAARVELVDVAILAFAQLGLGDRGAEVVRELAARMRGIEDQRDRRRFRSLYLKGQDRPQKLSSQ
jgi:hypothetical protein